MKQRKKRLCQYNKEKSYTENIKIKILGDITALSKGLQKSINDAVERTKDNNGITFSIALNYGGRDEIIHAVRKISNDVKNGKIEIDEIDEDTISDYLYTEGMPDPDLIIRTSGELRTSGFLTWQGVYSELLFLKKYWPDFSEEDLDNAVIEYQKRKRNFGAGKV